jgi:tetratricopeptide (TPR) repeat protein
VRAAVSRPARRGLPGPAHPGHTRTDYQPDPWATTAPARLLAPDSEGQSPVWGPAAVTVLIETAHRWPHIAHDQLCPLLHTQPHLVLAAGGVALARLAELPTVDPGALEAIEALLPPGRHVELDIAAAALTTRLTTHRLATTTDPAHRARLYTTLGYRLTHADQREQALTATTEAVDLYRRLAQTNPAAFEPNLAMALNNLGNQLSELGRREQALTATTDAADLYRRLAQTNPAAFEPNLATALTNLGIRLSSLGRRDEALAAATEAVDVCRRLVQTNPAAFEPNLARALNNLGIWLSSLGRRDQALTAATEAVDLCRRLAQTNPAAFEPDLARGLWTFARVRAADHIELPQALTAAEESTTRYEGLVQQLPQAFTDDLYGALATLADVLDGLDRSEEAADVRRRIGG